jgi:hypothetical protein
MCQLQKSFPGMTCLYPTQNGIPLNNLAPLCLAACWASASIPHYAHNTEGSMAISSLRCLRMLPLEPPIVLTSDRLLDRRLPLRLLTPDAAVDPDAALPSVSASDVPSASSLRTLTDAVLHTGTRPRCSPAVTSKSSSLRLEPWHAPSIACVGGTTRCCCGTDALAGCPPEAACTKAGHEY